MQGYIKLYRKLLDNPIVCKDSDHLSIWIYLLLNATHKEKSVVFQGKKITLKPGQLITGRKSISSEFRVSESKVQRVLKCFETEHQIEQQTGNKNRLITILSWDEYQSTEHQDEQQVNNKRTTTEQQVNTNKNVKNVKNERMKEKYADDVRLYPEEYEKLIAEHGHEMTSELIRILDNYKVANGKKYKSDYRAILNWVVDRYRENHRKGNVQPFPNRGQSIKPKIPIIQPNVNTQKVTDDELEQILAEVRRSG